MTLSSGHQYNGFRITIIILISNTGFCIDLYRAESSLVRIMLIKFAWHESYVFNKSKRMSHIIRNFTTLNSSFIGNITL